MTPHLSLMYLTYRLITVCPLIAQHPDCRYLRARLPEHYLRRERSKIDSFCFQQADQRSLNRSISLGGGDSMSFEFPQTIGQNDRRDSFQEFLQVGNPRTIMSRIIGNDQGWPNISTEA
ncbi:MAG TPA: hypothetical protein VEM60_04945, partial [Candidatus Dormibacteraeota bacterium]|nr:hypothetical protein [Candidatus Dormibacteraeota bacterium]